MIELAARSLVDVGARRTRALGVVGVVGLIAGTLSALSESVFQNQDFVWGVGLMVSGLFFALAVRGRGGFAKRSCTHRTPTSTSAAGGTG